MCCNEVRTGQVVSQGHTGRLFAPWDLGVEGKWERKKCGKGQICFNSFSQEEGIRVRPRAYKHF